VIDMALGRTSEAEISRVVLEVAAISSNDTASFRRLYKEIPTRINLTSGDKVGSTTRPGEETWKQIVRNIKSHYNIPGNIIFDGYATHVSRVGYKITKKGKKYINKP
jgi:hypothetical protein